LQNGEFLPLWSSLYCKIPANVRCLKPQTAQTNQFVRSPQTSTFRRFPFMLATSRKRENIKEDPARCTSQFIHRRSPGSSGANEFVNSYSRDCHSRASLSANLCCSTCYLDLIKISGGMEFDEFYNSIPSWFLHVFLGAVVFVLFQKYGGSLIQPL
jgi:hypothetical protein